MNDDMPESPLPVPKPYEKPVLAFGTCIQLKSLKDEREIKKVMTHRNSSKINKKELSVDERIFSYDQLKTPDSHK